MRNLHFNVNGQKLDKDKTTDLSYIIRGTDNYLCLVIKFDEEWKNTAKVVSLYDSDNNETNIIANNGIVVVPKKVTRGSIFSFKVTGKNGEKELTINRYYINQR